VIIRRKINEFMQQIWDPALFWWPPGTHCINMASSDLFVQRVVFVHFAPDFVFGTLLCFFNPPFQFPCYRKKCRLASRAEQNTGAEEKKKASQTKKTRRLREAN
jgi:hypothetical protein